MALAGARPVRAPRGTEITAKSWQTEAPLRMLQNNLEEIRSGKSLGDGCVRMTLRAFYVSDISAERRRRLLFANVSTRLLTNWTSSSRNMQSLKLSSRR